MSGVRLPDTARKRAAEVIAFEMGMDLTQRVVRLRCEDVAERALTAFCESMGFEEETRTFPTVAPLQWMEYGRLVSAWRPVEGEDDA